MGPFCAVKSDRWAPTFAGGKTWDLHGDLPLRPGKTSRTEQLNWSTDTYVFSPDHDLKFIPKELGKLKQGTHCTAIFKLHEVGMAAATSFPAESIRLAVEVNFVFSRKDVSSSLPPFLPPSPPPLPSWVGKRWCRSQISS